ncbi:MAG: hypothetical protein COB02_07790 [Candidatus Cloacimonadota bacterium]|nr:MAG: hypothetical protein COB02_07790 [Candidatus Cloacimonadota bacterium]
MKKKAFTLVEVMIAGTLAAAISIVLMTLLTRFYKNSEQFSGKVQTAQQANIILYHMKMALRGLKNVDSDVDGGAYENSFMGFDADNGEITFSYDAKNNSISILYGAMGTPKTFASGKVLGFRMVPLMSGITYEGERYVNPGEINMYSIELSMDDPQDNGLSDLDHAMKYYGVVTVRIPDEKIADPTWIPNANPFPSAGS